MATAEHGRLTRDAAEVQDACLEAAQAAEHCAVACSRTGDPEMARCIHLCRDVADLASLIARLVNRGSGSLPKVAQVAYGGCLTAADECARFELEACRIGEEALRSCAHVLETMGSGGPVDEEIDSVIHDQGGHSPFRHF